MNLHKILSTLLHEPDGINHFDIDSGKSPILGGYIRETAG